MGQPSIQQDGQNFATDMDWTEYGGQDCGGTAQLVQQIPLNHCAGQS